MFTAHHLRIVSNAANEIKRNTRISAYAHSIMKRAMQGFTHSEPLILKNEGFDDLVLEMEKLGFGVIKNRYDRFSPTIEVVITWGEPENPSDIKYFNSEGVPLRHAANSTNPITSEDKI